MTISTHVLDTMHGRPAAGVAVHLSRCEPDGRWVVLATTRTNADGRTDAPLLAGAAVVAGRYQLAFGIGDYFRSQGIDLPEPPFLDTVVLRVGIADPRAHHHVPLLVSPFAYSTYRGS